MCRLLPSRLIFVRRKEGYGLFQFSTHWGCDHHRPIMSSRPRQRAGGTNAPVTRTGALSKSTGTTLRANGGADDNSGTVVVMCNSILISPLDCFCGGTGGTGGTTPDLLRAGGTAEGYRCDRRADRTKRHHGGPTGPTVPYHQKSAELPAVPPVPPIPRGSGAFLSKCRFRSIADSHSNPSRTAFL
jgi:hypothetical protein